MAEDTLRIPNAAKKASLFELIGEDEDFRFGRVKPLREKPKWEIPAPTADDKDNILLVKTFKAVIVVAKKNFYQSDEDKAAGTEAKEKRALYIVRLDRISPEILYLSPTSLKNWKAFAAQIVRNGQALHDVVCEFGLEWVISKKSGFSWNKVTFKLDRTLNQEERDYIAELRPLVNDKAASFDEDKDLDDLEDQALGVAKPPAPAVAADDDDPREAHSRAAAASIDDDDDPAAKPGAGKKPAAATKPAAEAPKTEAQAPAGKAGYPTLDDDDEDLAAAGKTQTVSAAATPSLDDDD